MPNSRTALLIQVILFTSISLFAWSAAAKDGDGSNGPIPSAKPYLVSISVSDLDATIQWYQENLGFAVVKKMELPQYSLRIAFVELDGFQLELVEFKQSVSYEAIQKRFPVVDDRAKIQGLGKLAFLVEDIGVVAAKLKSHKVRFERDITDDKEFGVKFIIVADNSGNWIQFFQKMK